MWLTFRTLKVCVWIKIESECRVPVLQIFSTVITLPGPAFQEGSIIQSVIDKWSDCIGQDRDSHHLGTILQHFTHTMKPSDPLLLPDVTLCCKMYPAGKVDISRHLAIPGFPQSDHTVSEPSADAGSLFSEA